MKDKTICPWCGRPTSLRFDGMMNKHGYVKNSQELAAHRPKPCEGSGRSPSLGKSSAPALRLRISTV